MTYMHDDNQNCLKKGLFPCLFTLTFFVQRIVPIVILTIKADEYADNDYDGCPKGANPNSRILMSCVSIIYVIKITFLMFAKYSTVESSLVLESDAKGLMPYVVGDLFMNLTYESLVYLINLFVVFLETNELNIVLSALALEFISRLDDELKTLYFDFYPPNVEMLNAYINANNIPLAKGWCKVFYCFLCINKFVFYFFGVAVYFGMFYLPICKPGPPLPVDM